MFKCYNEVVDNQALNFRAREKNRQHQYGLSSMTTKRFNSGPHSKLPAADGACASFCSRALNSNKETPEQFDLPLVKPEQSDGKKWVVKLSFIKSEFDWKEHQILLRIQKSLTGVANLCLENWNPDVRTWDAFVRNFLKAFPPRKKLGNILAEASAFNSDRCNTYDVYEKLKNLRANWDEADIIIIELIIH
ncbi:unnamed protein product [Brassicogethes aeneus]|uniref:Uncharacterized protein n=1 Tax=Brassicogethes aeneus TaxID=1431903 RepID=A0A9P0BAQ6_BRAAE|nr:unnamed protein product [Brassicogethes aeneus]